MNINNLIKRLDKLEANDPTMYTDKKGNQVKKQYAVFADGNKRWVANYWPDEDYGKVQIIYKGTDMQDVRKHL